MTTKQDRSNLQSILNKLEETIAIASKKSQWFYLVRELLIKLIPSVAIASVTTYLILFYKRPFNLPYNQSLVFTYAAVMLSFGAIALNFGRLPFL